jgi:ribose transport system permease protein
MLLYTLSGLFVGNRGVLAASRLSSAQPVGGMGLELEAIAAVVIGGTSLQGGRGSMIGTVVGTLIVAVLTNGLRVTAVPQEWQNVVIGLVILVAVYLDMLRRRRA